MFTKAPRLGALLACAGLGLASSQVSATQYDMCFDEIAAQSAQIHQFQTMLMVGALKCRMLDPASLRRYGDFVTSRNGDLAIHSDTVRGAFEDRYGSVAGTRMFRLYETSMGNDFSRSEATRASCQDLGTYARMAERADHAGIAMIAGLATNRSVPFCPAQSEAAADETYVSRAVAASPAVREASAPGPHEAEFQAMVAAPVVPIAEEATPTVAAGPPPAPAESAEGAGKADSDARLAAAIQALDSAASALRAMQAGEAAN